jgi:hypothetical protein
VAVNKLSGGGLQRRPGRGFDAALSGAGRKTKASAFYFFFFIFFNESVWWVGLDRWAGRWAAAGLVQWAGLGKPLPSIFFISVSFLISVLLF